MDGLSELHSSSVKLLSSMRMPSVKNEEYRFTDISPLLQASLQLPSLIDNDELIGAAIYDRPCKQTLSADIVVVDGVVSAKHSKVTGLPKGVFIGSASDAPKEILSMALGSQTRSRAGPFATLNGAICRDAVVIYVPPETVIDEPIRILNLSSSSMENDNVPANAPRVLVVLEEKASAKMIEEFGPLDSNSKGIYCNFPVAEIELDDDASFTHHYVVMEKPGSKHMKSTFVNQGKSSQYSLVEARLGGEITRHDVGIEQLGSHTQTSMMSFILSGISELHDLHSKLKLNHPYGQAEQVHKCIAAHHSSRGVFDGNVKVNRLAQHTDAGQLSRNLLLAPRATVNVKPNLQIVADDVKCTHGCTVSDLADDELFYLRARGIDEATAREMLVYSFGREIMSLFDDELLLKRLETAVTNTLTRALSLSD